MNETQYLERLSILTKYAKEQLHKEWQRSRDYSDCIACIEKADELDLPNLKKELVGYLCEDEEGRNFYRSYLRNIDIDLINEETRISYAD